MQTRSQALKLAELRAKTDRQLAALIANKLDVGLNFARLVADPGARQRWASTDAFLAKAEHAFSEANTLLPWVDGAGTVERRRLELKLGQLRGLLDELSEPRECRAKAACF